MVVTLGTIGQPLGPRRDPQDSHHAAMGSTMTEKRVRMMEGRVRKTGRLLFVHHFLCHRVSVPKGKTSLNMESRKSGPVGAGRRHWT